MSKKKLLRRIEELERRLTLMENREQLRGNTYPPYCPVVIPWTAPDGTGTPAPIPPYRVGCNEGFYTNPRN